MTSAAPWNVCAAQAILDLVPEMAAMRSWADLLQSGGVRLAILVGDGGVSMSLPGVQSKLAVTIDDAGHVCERAAGGKPSS
jgi:hypothetical protein